MMVAPEPMVDPVDGIIEAVCASPTHSMAKVPHPSIRLIAGLGIEGDVHSGGTVQHASEVRHDPEQLNLRQVHLLGVECHAELRVAGFDLRPGEMGENVTTSGLRLMELPEGTRLHLGGAAVVEVTGQRDPCRQLNGVAPGLMAAVLGRDDQGGLVRNVGIMTIVVVAGDIRPGDTIRVELPPLPHRPLPVL